MERIGKKPNVEVVKGQVVRIIGDQVVKSVKILEFGSKASSKETLREFLFL